MRHDHLVLIARARWRVAFVLFLLAAALSVWLMSERNAPRPLYCGNVPVVVDSVVVARQKLREAERLAPWNERLGRHLDRKHGERLFKNNCASCHKTDADMSGPMLKGIFERAPKPALPYIHAFLTNQDSLLRAGNAYALALRETWGNYPWRHNQHDLTLDDTADLIAYIELYERRSIAVY